MKLVILAGGFGTRISEESHLKPKPMIEIGGKPIIWHIMKTYSHFGINDFIVCLGYKGYIIKEYFLNYYYHNCDITCELNTNKVNIHESLVDPWKVTLIETGENTQTGGRIKRIEKYINNETFCLTYGDGLANVNISELISFHEKSTNKATLTAVQQPGRFGGLNIQNEKITSFIEKPKGDGGWINGGFFVLEPSIFEFIDGDNTIWEQEPLQNLASNGFLGYYKHEDFWQPMDTLRDKKVLEELWARGNAPWQVWSK